MAPACMKSEVWYHPHKIELKNVYEHMAGPTDVKVEEKGPRMNQCERMIGGHLTDLTNTHDLAPIAQAQ